MDNHTGADVLALCTGMRPVVMVDYGGKMPELQERLCTLMELSQKVTSCCLIKLVDRFLLEYCHGLVDILTLYIKVSTNVVLPVLYLPYSHVQ